MKSYLNLKRMKIQNDPDNNFTKSLENDPSYKNVSTQIKRELRRSLKTDRKFIPIDDYILYFSRIPDSLWNTKPIFYYHRGEWDALGFLDERTHRSNLRSKFLQMCFKEIGINITELMDGELPGFNFGYKLNILEGLVKLKKDITNQKMIGIYKNSKILCDDKDFR